MSSAKAMVEPQVVRVKRKVLSACMTCPLCHKLLRDATAISTCLHTFCRKCIVDYFSDEDWGCCPICNIGLGRTPVEKLRPDHNLEVIRTKILPYKRRKFNAPKVLRLTTLPIRRKERSLSSLVDATPEIRTQTGFREGTKAAANGASTLRGLNSLNDEHAKKSGDNSEHIKENSSKTLICYLKRQNSSNGERSDKTSCNKRQHSNEIFVDKSSLPSPAIKVEETVNFASDGHVHKVKVCEHSCKLKFQDEIKNVPTSPEAVNARRVHGVGRKIKVLRPSAQSVLDAADAGSERRIIPIWLSLVSSPERGGDTKLP
ncbi:E3 ubiquitin protein ligase DRIP2-like isoform X2 [Phalaenopsis equestris]|uniref:E3 ubiquitin protein ligase DRIP2-like isoform X2 n=1 Tax=Phalaenopsis equestris TaxID=78828 RepID=UPI0009E2FEEB|nr:E3 ubiquitin protein ligase DRIP2-like isoform X2 [Phalaenopsis equestris]